MWHRTGDKIITWTIDDEDHWQINSRGYFILFRLILFSLIIWDKFMHRSVLPSSVV